LLWSVSFAILLASPSVFAQWPWWPTSGVPRTPEGQVNLDAPPPRTADGRVDFSGIWAIGTNLRFGSFSLDDGPSGRPQPAPGRPPLATAFEVGANMKGGVPLQPWAAELKKRRMAAHTADNPQSNCLPIGHMQLWLHYLPHKIVQTPREVVLFWEAHYGLRQILMDGRPSPSNDPQPWWYGYTVGRWEGDTLVATTTNLRDGMWLDINGTPLSDAATIVERIRRPTFGRIEIDVTIDDPKVFTRPFTVAVNQQIQLNTELMEFICHENEQSSKHYVR
jgi:hypothetical protein